uniref:TSA: Wollemia nobilis Ref_Wollemi_Transcript_6527_3458 transcribed RNA sequence n=1 Tax=Wollemia nobilis TaxID=56998 RepID=A0A0C9RXB3_9CONI
MNKTKNFRRRAEDDDVDDDANRDNTENLVIRPPQSGTKNIKKSNKEKEKERSSKRSVGSNLLSFGEEDGIKDKLKPKPKSSVRNLLSFVADDDATEQSFQKTKKKTGGLGASHGGLVHKILGGKEAAAQPSIPSNVQPQAGEYTKEKLLELQKNTRSLGGSKPAPPPPAPPGNKKAHSETVVVLKGLVKPSLQENEKLETEAEAEAEAEGERLKEDVKSRLGAMGIESAVSIPDQATINAIRAKRERLRQARTAPDYIPLEGARISAELLKDEADSSDDDGEVHSRLAMVGDKPAEVKKGVFEVLDRARVDGDHEDDEDEEKRWEEEQFRKGFGKRVDDGSNRVSAAPSANSASISVPMSAPSSYQAVQASGYVGSGYTAATAAPPAANWTGGGVTRSVEVMSMSQHAEVAERVLQESLQRLRETHGRTKSDLNRVDENLSTSLTNITILEKSLASAGEKYIFMQKLRDFIAVLCDFLQDKAPYIEELEEQMQKLHEERATAILERRASDDADEMAEVEAAINAAKSVLSKGGGAATAAAAAAAAQAAAAATRDGSNLPPQLDEFGRDINLQKRADIKRRAEARKQRRACVALKKATSVTFADSTASQHIEGESSSGESDSDCRAYQSSRGELLRTAEHVFGDAAEEFSQLSIVKERFEGWKRLFTSAYRDAYMSLSAPAIFSPYVRLELLKWDPLYEDADFNTMNWHTLLFDYGVPENIKDFEPDDADADLVPGLLEKVALPILHHEVAHCWDRLSLRGTKNAVAAVQVILNYIPASNEALQELLAAVRMRLAEAVAELQVPTWSIPLMNSVSQASRIAAYRFGMAVRLLRNIALWKDILAMPVLEQLALDELLCGKMLPHLRNVVQHLHDAITRTERVVAALSGIWTGPSFSGELSHKLLPLVEYITTLGKELEKKQSLGASTEDISALARRLKKMLVELNEYDKARRILKIFQLKEAL